MAFEELLGALADWIGIDLRPMSARRRVLAVLFYSLIGLVLLTFGVAGLLLNWNDGWAIFFGAVCALLGAGWLVRITWNIVMLVRARRDKEGRR